MFEGSKRRLVRLEQINSQADIQSLNNLIFLDEFGEK